MGRAAALKQQKFEEKEQAFKDTFAYVSRKHDEAKRQPPKPLLPFEFFNQYGGRFVRPSESFVDRLKSNSPDRKRKEFIKHLFNKFPVPDFLYEASKWESNNYDNIAQNTLQGMPVTSLHAVNIREWYICIASGGSFYKEIAKEFFTKKEVHLFLNCPFKITLPEALVYAVAKAEGATDGIALRISKSKLQRERMSQFTKEVIRWFVANPPASYQLVDDYFDYVKDRRAINHQFTLMGSGYTIESLKNKVEQWHRDLQRMKNIKQGTWSGAMMADSEYTDKTPELGEFKWFFTQLLNSNELQKEGNAQRHCVASYVDSCVKGRCSIWSLRMGTTLDTAKTSDRKLTIEMLSDGTIVQARGVANRPPKPIEKRILNRWAFDNGLYVRI